MSLLGRFFGATDGAKDGGTVDVAEARRRQREGAILVDVREPEEWRRGRAPGARHIPLGALGKRIGELPRDRDVLLICRSGNRSGMAQRTLRGQGYDRALNVAGGMNAWAAAGLPVVRADDRPGTVI
jgi:rhodanese-related sulfurtransferase